MVEEYWDHFSNPGHYFSRIAKGLARVGDVGFRELGFATAHLPVLTALKDGAHMSQAELARWAKVEQPTMAQMLARMERDRLVRRQPDPDDGRGSLVSLTKYAQARLPAGRAILKQANADMTNGLSKSEVDLLIGLLRRVLDNVEAMEAKSHSAPAK